MVKDLVNIFFFSSYDVVRPIDLFQALDAAGRAAGSFSEYGSDFSFIDYYRSWTEQSGHPILNVQVNHQTGDMTITQVFQKHPKSNDCEYYQDSISNA